MQVMFNVTNPLQREQTMTKGEDRAKVIAIKELLERDEDFVRSAVQSFVQEALEAEMTEALSAGFRTASLRSLSHSRRPRRAGSRGWNPGSLAGRSYAPKGETPVALAPGTRQKLSMISTVTNQGKARWMIIDGNFNADQLIEFLEALIKRCDEKSLSDPRQFTRPPFKASQSVACRANRSHRGFLLAKLRTRPQSGRAPERRHEARYRRQGSAPSPPLATSAVALPSE